MLTDVQVFYRPRRHADQFINESGSRPRESQHGPVVVRVKVRVHACLGYGIDRCFGGEVGNCEELSPCHSSVHEGTLEARGLTMCRAPLDIALREEHNSPLGSGGALSAKRSDSTGAPSSLAPVGEQSPDLGVRDEVRPVTALFADIVGSTALGEFLEIDEVKALVGECTTRIAEVIERHGGVIGSFMGDGVAAFFGMEAAREDDQLRAASAALEVRSVVGEYALEVQAAWGVENLDVRIGINSGRVATGLVGGSVKQIHALGDAVNVAARLQSLAEPGAILIGSQVAKAISSEFDVQRIGSVVVKGRTKKVDAFRLLAAGSRDAPITHRSLVGRLTELARFETILDDLSHGRGQILFLLGEPGIGKSRLVEEARQRAGSEILWLDARASTLRSPVPYEAFVEAIRSWLGLEQDVPDVAVRVRLKARLRSLAGAGGDELASALSRMLGLQPRTRVDHTLDGLPVDVRSRALHVAFLDWVTAVARKDPLVLTIDPYERLDEASKELVKELAEVTDVAPLLLAVCSRPDEASELRVLALTDFAHRSEELRLGPLSDECAYTLVRALDSEDVISPEVAQVLVARSEGNPLYLHELFNAIVGSDGTSAVVVGNALPPALETVLLARLDRLPRGVREVAQAAAVLGRDFSRDTLAAMVQGADVDEGLRTLLRADVIRERRREPSTFGFKHGLLREATLSTLPRRRLQELHARAADAIEAQFGPEPRDSVAALAAHALAAGDEERALVLLERLGERYASVHRLDEAIELLETCLQLVPTESARTRLRLGCRLAELLIESGDSTSAMRVMDGLEDGRLSSAARLELQARKGELLTNAGLLGDAEPVLAAALAESTPGVQQNSLRAQLAALYLRRQDLAKARSAMEALGDPDSLPDEIALQASSVWSGYLAAAGDFVTARTWGTRSLAIARRIGRTGVELRALRQLGVINVLNGRLSDGLKLLKESFDRARELGYTLGMVESGVNLVHAAYLVGDLDEAEESSRRVLDLSESPFLEAHVKVNLATVLYERDDLRNAEAIARRVLSLGVEVTSPAPQIAAHALLGKLHAVDERWEAAEAALRRALEIAEQLGGRGGLMGSVRGEFADLALARGDAERALDEAEDGLARMEFVEKPLVVPLLRAKGAALAHLNVEDGLAVLADARNMGRVMEMRLEEARTLVALGRVSVADADRYFGEATEIFMASGAKRGMAELAVARELISS